MTIIAEEIAKKHVVQSRLGMQAPFVEKGLPGASPSAKARCGAEPFNAPVIRVRNTGGLMRLDDRFAGHVMIGNVLREPLLSAYVGYWVDSRVAGGGVITAAVALAVDHCFGPVGLHRLEATVRPENAASLDPKAAAHNVGARVTSRTCRRRRRWCRRRRSCRSSR